MLPTTPSVVLPPFKTARRRSMMPLLPLPSITASQSQKSDQEELLLTPAKPVRGSFVKNKMDSISNQQVEQKREETLEKLTGGVKPPLASVTAIGNTKRDGLGSNKHQRQNQVRKTPLSSKHVSYSQGSSKPTRVVSETIKITPGPTGHLQSSTRQPSGSSVNKPFITRSKLESLNPGSTSQRTRLQTTVQGESTTKSRIPQHFVLANTAGPGLTPSRAALSQSQPLEAPSPTPASKSRANDRITLLRGSVSPRKPNQTNALSLAGKEVHVQSADKTLPSPVVCVKPPQTTTLADPRPRTLSVASTPSDIDIRLEESRRKWLGGPRPVTAIATTTDNASPKSIEISSVVAGDDSPLLKSRLSVLDLRGNDEVESRLDSQGSPLSGRKAGTLESQRNSRRGTRGVGLKRQASRLRLGFESPMHSPRVQFDRVYEMEREIENLRDQLARLQTTATTRKTTTRVPSTSHAQTPPGLNMAVEDLERRVARDRIVATLQSVIEGCQEEIENGKRCDRDWALFERLVAGRMEMNLV